MMKNHTQGLSRHLRGFFVGIVYRASLALCPRPTCPLPSGAEWRLEDVWNIFLDNGVVMRSTDNLAGARRSPALTKSCWHQAGFARAHAAASSARYCASSALRPLFRSWMSRTTRLKISPRRVSSTNLDRSSSDCPDC